MKIIDKVKLTKEGGSTRMTIPRSINRFINWEAGEVVSVELKGNKLIIKKESV